MGLAGLDRLKIEIREIQAGFGIAARPMMCYK